MMPGCLPAIWRHDNAYTSSEKHDKECYFANRKPFGLGRFVSIALSDQTSAAEFRDCFAWYMILYQAKLKRVVSNNKMYLPGWLLRDSHSLVIVMNIY